MIHPRPTVGCLERKPTGREQLHERERLRRRGRRRLLAARRAARLERRLADSPQPLRAQKPAHSEHAAAAVLLDLLVQRRPSAREVELAGAVASEQ